MAQVDMRPAELEEVTAARLSAGGLIEAAEVFPVKDDADERGAVELLARMKRQVQQTEAARVRLTKPLNDYIKGINDELKGVKGPLEAAISSLSARVVGYRDQRERERQEEIEAQLAEQREREAKEAAEREVREQREQAEQDRLERERKEAEAAGERKRAEELEEQRLKNAEAAKVQAQRDHERRLQEQAAVVLPEVRPNVTRTSAGSAQVRRPWKFAVTDEMLVPRQYLMVDERLLRAAVADGVREIPGVRIFQDPTLAVSARK